MIRLKLALLLLLALIACTALWHRYKPLPDGLAHESPLLPAMGLNLLVDDTWETADGGRGMRQRIFDETLRLIEQARQLVVVDMFLFNAFQGADDARRSHHISGLSTPFYQFTFTSARRHIRHLNSKSGELYLNFMNTPITNNKL